MPSTRLILLYCSIAILCWSTLHIITVEFFNDMTVHFWKIVFLICSVITVFVGYMTYLAEQRDKDIAAKKSALSGKLTTPKKVKPKVQVDSTKLRSSEEIKKELKDRTKPPEDRKKLLDEHYEAARRELLADEDVVWIVFGGNELGTSRKKLKTGSVVTPVQITDEKPISVRLINDSLKVSGYFTSLDGKITAKLTDNEWEINENNYFQRNYDDHGLEVTDDSGFLKFQIDYIDESRIVINGFFKMGGGYIRASNEGMTGWREDKLENIKEESAKVPFMFVHPAKLHFGERAKK